jgi:DNA-binding MarR family transcriptional regulator
MELWELVRLVSERYGKRLEEHKEAQAGRSGFGSVTVQQFQYLQAIRRAPEATVSYLKSYFGVRSPSATMIVHTLEAKGLLKKKPNSHDQRSNYLVLTPKALKLLEAQENAFVALGEDIQAALSPTDLKTYTRLTEQVCSALERKP